jgi:xylose isomerase
MDKSRFAAILGVYGKPADRFMAGGYKGAAPDVFERLKLAAAGGLVRGVELIEGEKEDIHSGNYKQVKAAASDLGMSICAINPNLWGEMQWGGGTLGSSDARIRSQAVDRVKRAMDLAAQVDCDYVGIWPGQDGYDYLFEADYQKMYDYWVEGVQQAADSNQAVRLGLEYKPYEPRTHSFLDTTTKTLLVLKDIDRANAGLTMDVGHAMYAHENLGEAVSLAQRWGKLFHLHLNDNYADWDWDLNFGSVHLYDFIEMLYWLKRTGYQGWTSIDIFTYRTEAAASIDESLLWLQAMSDLIDRAGMPAFDELIAASDPIAVSRFMRGLLFPAA